MVDDKDSDNNDNKDRELEDIINKKLADQKESTSIPEQLSDNDKSEDLASESSEKKIEDPQDIEQEAPQDIEQEASQDIEQEVSQDIEQEAPQDIEQEVWQDIGQEAEAENQKESLTNQDATDEQEIIQPTEQPKFKISNYIGTIAAVIFMLLVMVLLYMKYSGDCSILGRPFQYTIGYIICPDQDNEISDDIQSEENNQVLRKEVKDPFQETQSVKSVKAQSEQDGEAVNQESTSLSSTESEFDSSQDDYVGDADPNSPQHIKEIYETPALLVAENKQKITSKLPSRVKSMGFRDGQIFNKDDILATLDCKEIELDLEIQREVYKEKAASLNNLKKLRELKSTSEYSVVKAQAEHGQSEKLIEKYEKQINDCVIKAEFDGKVISTDVTEGEYIYPGKEIMVVNNNKDLLVKAYIPVIWLDWLVIGTTFKMCIGEICHHGVVTRLGAEVDAISQTLDVFGRLLEHDDSLIAGLSGQINFDK